MKTNYISKENTGWFKVPFGIFRDPVVTKDHETFYIWVYLLALASHTECELLFGSEPITVPEGELIVTASQISEALEIEETKVKRTLKLFESARLIEKQTSHQNTHIIIANWSKHHGVSEKQNARRLHDGCTTPAPQAHDGCTAYNIDYIDNKNYKDSIYSSSACEEWNGGGEEEKKNLESSYPSEYEVKVFAESIGSQTDPHEFWSYYNLNGWTIGDKPIKNWKALFRKWKPASKPQTGSFDTEDFFEAAVRRSLGQYENL